MPNTLTNDQIISATYVAMFQRAPDLSGLTDWRANAAASGKAEGSMDLAKDMAVKFGAHPAFTTLYGGMGDAAFIDAIYTNIGGKVADAQGKAAWLAKLTDAAHPITRAELVGEFIHGVLSITVDEINALAITAAEKTDAIARQDRLTNKATVALEFTKAMGAGSNLAAGTDGMSLTSLAKDPAYVASQAIISAVTEVDSTMTAPSDYLKATPTLNGIITTFGSGSSAGGVTFTLTTNVDNIVGTSGNDTIIGDNTGVTKQLTVADQINGGAGTDTLKVYLADGDTALTLPTLNSVEVLEFTGGSLAAIDASVITGLTSLSVDGRVGTGGSATAGAFTYTLGGQSLTLANAKANTTSNAGVIVTTTTIASTTDTAQNVTLNKFGNTSRTVSTTTYTDTNTLDIAGAKVTALTLTSSGGTNAITVTNTGAKLDTLTIKGDKALTVTENLAALKTINAADATGNVTVNASGANAALAFTGGSGNDKIALAAGTLVNTQVLNGGSAGTDTVVLADTNLNATQITAANTALKNIDILGFNGATIAQGLSTITAVSQFSVEAAMTGTAGGTAAATTGTGANGGIAADFSGQANAQSFIVNANLTGGAGQDVNATGLTAGSGGAGLKVAPTLDNGSNAVALTLSGVTIQGGAAGSYGTAATTSMTAGANGVAVDLSAFETVTITSNADAAGTVTTNTFTGGNVGTAGGSPTQGAGLTVGANATITISGSAAANLGAVVSNVGQVVNNNITLNAGNLSGNLTVGTGAGNDVITAGSGVNSITLAGGVDSVDLSKSAAKADTITVSSAAGTSKTGIISITGFTNALNTGDKLDLVNGTNFTLQTSGSATVNAGTATAVTATANAKGVISFTAVGASAALSDYIDAAFSVVTGAANKHALFQFGNDTYVVGNVGNDTTYAAGTDHIIKLVGVTGITELSTTASGVNTVWAV